MRSKLNGESRRKSLDSYLKLAISKGMDHALFIETSEVYTAPWVRLKCQYGCRFYGKSLCCPPITPTDEHMRKVLDSYSRAILLHKVWEAETLDIKSFNETVVDIELALFFDGHYNAWGLGSGPCRRCDKCNMESGCSHIQRARPSMEACGIDVFKTAAGKGLPFPVLRSTKAYRNSFGLVLVK